MNSDDPTRLSAEEAERLHRQYAESLLKFLLGVTGNHEDAHDCLQSTFVILQQKGGSCLPGARKAWLFRVAHNEAMKLFRRRKLASLEASQGVDDPSDHSQSSPIQSIVDRERMGEVRKAVDGLTDDLKVVVELRIYEGLLFREISDRLGIPLGTALARMRLALRKLGDRLDDHD